MPSLLYMTQVSSKKEESSLWHHLEVCPWLSASLCCLLYLYRANPASSGTPSSPLCQLLSPSWSMSKFDEQRIDMWSPTFTYKVLLQHVMRLYDEHVDNVLPCTYTATYMHRYTHLVVGLAPMRLQKRVYTMLWMDMHHGTDWLHHSVYLTSETDNRYTLDKKALASERLLYSSTKPPLKTDSHAKN